LSSIPGEGCSQLQIELLRDACGVHMFVNSFSVPLPCCKERSDRVDLYVSAGGRERRFRPDRLKGGQRLRLSDEARDFILEALKSGECVELRAGRYRSSISPVGFYSAYCSTL